MFLNCCGHSVDHHFYLSFCTSKCEAMHYKVFIYRLQMVDYFLNYNIQYPSITIILVSKDKTFRQLLIHRRKWVRKVLVIYLIAGILKE